MFGALKATVNIKQAKNIVDGVKNSDGDYWPEENPFSLLASGPLYTNSFQQGDGVRWAAEKVPNETSWYIWCPHYEGLFGGDGNQKGRQYIYVYGSRGWPAWGSPPAGSFWLRRDAGH